MLALLLLGCLPLIFAQVVQYPLAGPDPHAGSDLDTRPRPPHSLPPPIDNSTAPFVFNSLSSLLVQWHNTYHPNGHTIISGVVEPFTLLYHARTDAQTPVPSPEWLAFDSEMSYGIMAGHGGHTYLHTYRTIRPAKIIYFDGMSAALDDSGWLDSQEVFITGRGRGDTQDYPIWNEFGRLLQLCKWGMPRGIEGIVRMNSGFELMWCDFNSPSIQLVSHLNITPPGTPPGNTDQPFPSVPTGPLPTGPRRGSGPRRPWGTPSPLASVSFSEWTRAAAHRGLVPQPHVILDYSTFVTFYHPRLHSLVPAREGQRMRTHRIWPNISDADAQSVVAEMEEVVARLPWRGAGSGMDWGALARGIVEGWADRIVQLREFLANATAGLGDETGMNLTEALVTVRRLTYAPLNAYMDTASASSNTSAWDLFFGVALQSPDLPPRPHTPPSSDSPPDSYIFSDRHSLHLDSPAPPPPFHPCRRSPLPSSGLPSSSAPSANPPDPCPSPRPRPPPIAKNTAVQRCIYSATEFLKHNPRIHKTPQEELLQSSIETVMERLCIDYGTMFAESMDTDPKATKDALKTMLENWHARVIALVEWLDWTEWLRCDEVCSRDSICAMPMWPISFFRRRGGPRRPGDNEEEDGPDAWQPKCFSLTPQPPEFPPPYTGMEQHVADALVDARSCTV
ncbi:hypothetical protein AcV7_004860 [Taiwanofungus camphoratus]|nr:hypothetical protein AcW2_007639 [Antrodia cinnamomea]KAI0930767.1 hypothetical protein AcV7_004860 [Antrodia cinnamomea]